MRWMVLNQVVYRTGIFSDDSPLPTKNVGLVDNHYNSSLHIILLAIQCSCIGQSQYLDYIDTNRLIWICVTHKLKVEEKSVVAAITETRICLHVSTNLAKERCHATKESEKGSNSD